VDDRKPCSQASYGCFYFLIMSKSLTGEPRQSAAEDAGTRLQVPAVRVNSSARGLIPPTLARRSFPPAPTGRIAYCRASPPRASAVVGT
jgi:hypothetical protein